MSDEKKNPQASNDSERAKRAEERNSLTAKIQFLEKQLIEKEKRNETLVQASKDLNEANKNLTDANSELTKANDDLSKANQKLAEANSKLSGIASDSKKSEH